MSSVAANQQQELPSSRQSQSPKKTPLRDERPRKILERSSRPDISNVSEIHSTQKEPEDYYNKPVDNMAFGTVKTLKDVKDLKKRT